MRLETEDSPPHPSFAGNYPDQVSEGRPWQPPSIYPDYTAGRATDRSNSTVQDIWLPILPTKCAEAQRPGEESHCGTVHVLYPYIVSPLYVMENMYDSFQVTSSGEMPESAINTESGKAYLRYMGVRCIRREGKKVGGGRGRGRRQDNLSPQISRLLELQLGMRNSTSVLKEGDGIFLPSCYNHVGGLGVGGSTTIHGHESGKVLGDWFYDREVQDVLVLRDSCDAANDGLP